MLLAGQSNLGGTTGTTAPTDTNLIGDIDDAFIYNGTTYETLNYPNNNDGLLFGCELGLAYNYKTKIRRTIYMEKVWDSGAPISAEASRNDWNVSTNELIDDGKDALQRLVDKSVDVGSKNPVFVVVWIQGERDARTDTGDEYKANFEAIMTEFNTIQTVDLWIMNTLNPLILANGNGFTEATIDSVIQAQSQLIAENNNMIRLDMRNYTLGTDDLHFTGASQEQLGLDIYEKIRVYFNIN